MHDLLAYRSRFPILERATYLISNSLGAMPGAAAEALTEYTARWAEDGVRAWQGWWDLPATVAGKVAPLIGAPPASVSMHLNVASVQAVVASCFDFSGPRNKVVFTDMNFPSVSYFYKEQERLGARVKIVRSRDGVGVDLDELLDAIDEKTLLVPISHVLFRSAFIQDAEAIAEKCRRVGARLVLDVYQSAGVLPMSLEEWGVDFAAGGTLKWLCGGPGAAFLYVRPDLAKTLRPGFTGWMADAEPFNFNVEEHVLTDGPYRFMNGTPNIPGLYAAIPGLDIVAEIGVERIRDNSMRQTAMLLRGAEERGWKTTTPQEPNQRAGTVAFDLPDGYEIAQELIARGVLVDYRPKAGVRVSPHFYTSDEEIARFFRETEDIIATGAHLKQKNTQTVVT